MLGTVLIGAGDGSLAQARIKRLWQHLFNHPIKFSHFPLRGRRNQQYDNINRKG